MKKNPLWNESRPTSNLTFKQCQEHYFVLTKALMSIVRVWHWTREQSGIFRCMNLFPLVFLIALSIPLSLQWLLKRAERPPSVLCLTGKPCLYVLDTFQNFNVIKHFCSDTGIALQMLHSGPALKEACHMTYSKYSNSVSWFPGCRKQGFKDFFIIYLFLCVCTVCLCSLWVCK